MLKENAYVGRPAGSDFPGLVRTVAASPADPVGDVANRRPVRGLPQYCGSRRLELPLCRLVEPEDAS
jgi:hypothetical protein